MLAGAAASGPGSAGGARGGYDTMSHVFLPCATRRAGMPPHRTEESD